MKIMSSKLIRLTVSMTLLFGMCVAIAANPELTEKKKKTNGNDGDQISLVAYGTGDTKEEATQNALRSALEQAYGTFVSSNTKVVNDELVKDEIVSISSGNIVSYEILSFMDTTPKEVSVNAVVSVSKLTSFAQNKGMDAELAGGTFAMNMKMQELNIQNEKKALEHFVEEVQLNSSRIFDYRIDLDDPKKQGDNVFVGFKLKILANNNTLSFYDMVHNTLGCLAESKKTTDVPSDEGLRFPKVGKNAVSYKLRSGSHGNDGIGVGLIRAIEKAMFDCEIVDNIGSVNGFMIEDDYDQSYLDMCCYITCIGRRYIIPYGSETSYMLTKVNAHENPQMYMQFIKNKETYVDSWLGANKPKVGDVLWTVPLTLAYKMDNFSKVSKIEVRPSQKLEMKSVNAQTDALVNESLKSIHTLCDYAEETDDKDEAIRLYKKAYEVYQGLETIPNISDYVHPGTFKKYKEHIEQGLNKLGVKF